MMNEPLYVLIDADPLVYRDGFAAQATWYNAHWCDVRDPEDPYLDRDYHVRMRPKWRLEELLRLKNVSDEEVTIKPHIVAEPVENALHIVRQSIQTILDAVSGAVKDYPEMRKRELVPRLFLSSKRNFRNKAATIRGYKANRDPSHKPVHYAAIREYLVEHWDAEVCVGFEADDAVAIAQSELSDEYAINSIIATIDKDLAMIPGWHYNINTAKDKVITEPEGLLSFYRQVLTGDASDNIPGLYKVGPKAALDLLPAPMPEKLMFRLVLTAYVENLSKYMDDAKAVERNFGQYAEKAKKWVGGAAFEMLQENARLLWMQREADELWVPPGAKKQKVSESEFVDFGEDEDEF